MAYIPRPGDITLFPNDYKKEEKHPDMRGTVLGFDGVTYDLALWEKQINGKACYSGKMSPQRPRADINPSVRPDERSAPPTPRYTPPQKSPDFFTDGPDDLPFN